jgi:hypothetical protein
MSGTHGRLRPPPAWQCNASVACKRAANITQGTHTNTRATVPQLGTHTHTHAHTHTHTRTHTHTHTHAHARTGCGRASATPRHAKGGRACGPPSPPHPGLHTAHDDWVQTNAASNAQGVLQCNVWAAAAAGGVRVSATHTCSARQAPAPASHTPPAAPTLQPWHASHNLTSAHC